MSDVSDGIVIGSAVVDLIKKSIDSDGVSSSEELMTCLDFTREISKALKHN
jgi:tryptophan synthase alpha subunit